MSSHEFTLPSLTSCPSFSSLSSHGSERARCIVPATSPVLLYFYFLEEFCSQYSPQRAHTPSCSPGNRQRRELAELQSAAETLLGAQGLHASACLLDSHSRCYSEGYQPGSPQGAGQVPSRGLHTRSGHVARVSSAWVGGMYPMQGSTRPALLCYTVIKE